MQTLLAPAEYFAPGTLECEQERLFRRAWCFVGLANEVANPDDWIAVELGGRAVTVQNFDGEVRAFHNVCSHRFSVMRPEGCGHGALRCPYHGWIYNAEGLPSAIPARPRFSDLDVARVRELALERFSLERCGEFLFVRLGPEGSGLRDYLGEEAWMALEEISTALHECVGRQDVHIKANWKLVVENGLEGYHAGFVHPETLGKIRSNRFSLHAAGHYCRYLEQASPEARGNWRRVEKAFASRPLRTDDYVHHFIFPNFSIDALRGATFAMSVVRPTSADGCVLRSQVFSTRLQDGRTDHSLVRAYNRLMAEFAQTVVQEDRVAVELVGRGVREASKPGILSEEEIRVGAFQRNYRAFIDGVTKTATDARTMLAALPPCDYHSTPSLSRGPGVLSA